jgi:hypothetical protein
MVNPRNVTKEFEQFVDIVYATYGRNPFEADRKNIIRAWYDVVGDIDVELLRIKFVELATISKVMPTPGGVRRHVFEDKLSDIVSPAEAWAQLQNLRVSLNSGVERPLLASTVVETIQKLGDTAFGLTTNGDREYFLEVYRDIYNKKLIELLKVNL